MKAEIIKVNQENQELVRRLAEAEKMLAQTSGHQVMKQKIDREKRTTRDALSYVAELKRELSIFHASASSVSLPFDSVSNVDSDHMNTTQVEEEKKQERKERMMELL